jgi:cAMP-dependent protein kinase regulator
MFRSEIHRSQIHGVPATRIEMLRRLPMFRTYSDEELLRVDALVYETTLPAGARLTVEGHVRRQAFIILSGEATIDAGSARLGTAGFGDLIGEMSLLDHRPQNATVTAQTPLRVLVMDPREFITLMSEPRAARWLAGEVNDRVRDNLDRTAAPHTRRHAVPAAAVHVPA